MYLRAKNEMLESLEKFIVNVEYFYFHTWKFDWKIVFFIHY